jgi:hypothetical protein
MPIHAAASQMARTQCAGIGPIAAVFVRLKISANTATSAEIAPLAPIIGVVEAGSAAHCAAAPT